MVVNLLTKQIKSSKLSGNYALSCKINIIISPVWTLSPTFNSAIETDAPFSRETLAWDGKHAPPSHLQQAHCPVKMKSQHTSAQSAPPVHAIKKSSTASLTPACTDPETISSEKQEVKHIEYKSMRSSSLPASLSIQKCGL